MNRPFFSIIIPTFNQANFLSIALRSIKNQKFKKFEVIVIDNFSTDSTRSVISEFKKYFKKKLIYKKIKNNGIIAKSRNRGIKISKGDWLCFLDSDDYWLPNKLAYVFNLIKRKNYEVICHSEIVINNLKNKKKIWSFGPLTKNFYKTLLLKGNRLSTSATCVKKDFINEKKIEFDENKIFVTAEDYSFFLKIAKFKAYFYFINEPLGCRLIHSNSASYQKQKHFKAVKSVLRYHVTYIQNIVRNKNTLWNLVYNNFNFRNNIIPQNKNKLFLEYYFNFFVLFLKSPKNNFEYLLFIVAKSIKNFYFTNFYYKNQIKSDNLRFSNNG